MLIKKLFICALTLYLITGCSTASSLFAKKVSHFGFTTTYIQSPKFRHAIFENGLPDSQGILHVYLGGDGTPWFQGRYVTRDPTPLKPVMLELMGIDKQPAIYLGRPCYHQVRMPDHCKKSLWTSQRYSNTVVASMVDVLRQYIQQHGYREIRLFGFSGGGTLVMLMAPHLAETRVVVTVAGNLDTDRWADHHGYIKLAGSLNPVNMPPLPLGIRQFHFAGALDKSVPASIIAAAARRQNNAVFLLQENIGHHCCWKSVWRSLLKEVN